VKSEKIFGQEENLQFRDKREDIGFYLLEPRFGLKDEQLDLSGSERPRS
jgi:hypothetical protein